MIYMIFGTVLGLFFFICLIKAYTLGLEHGKSLGNNNIPTVNINPVSSLKTYVKEREEKRQADVIEEGWANIFSYDGTPQKKEGDK